MVGKLGYNRTINCTLRVIAYMREGMSLQELKEKTRITDKQVSKSVIYLEDMKLVKTGWSDGRTKYIESYNQLISDQWQSDLKKLIRKFDKVNE